MMKKYFVFLMMISCVLFSGCGSQQNMSKNNTEDIKEEKNEPYVINTFYQTNENLIDEYFENSKEIITKTYYEMNDNTWKTDDYTYKYRLEVSGKTANAAKGSTYIILSNTDDITFEQAWKASGFSSNLDDYFDEKDAVFVGFISY